MRAAHTLHSKICAWHQKVSSTSLVIQNQLQSCKQQFCRSVRPISWALEEAKPKCGNLHFTETGFERPFERVSACYFWHVRKCKNITNNNDYTTPYNNTNPNKARLIDYTRAQRSFEIVFFRQLTQIPISFYLSEKKKSWTWSSQQKAGHKSQLL